MAFGKKIRLIIADDEPVARAGIRAILSQAGDIEVVGEAPDGFEGWSLIFQTRWQRTIGKSKGFPLLTNVMGWLELAQLWKAGISPTRASQKSFTAKSAKISKSFFP